MIMTADNFGCGGINSVVDDTVNPTRKLFFVAPFQGGQRLD